MYRPLIMPAGAPRPTVPILFACLMLKVLRTIKVLINQDG
jgi:hypothetical protein